LIGRSLERSGSMLNGLKVKNEIQNDMSLHSLDPARGIPGSLWERYSNSLK